MFPIFALAGLVLVLTQPNGASDPRQPWVAEVEAWRAAREAELKKPDGWLSVAGLYFLRSGVNTVGADPNSDLSLPAGAAPEHAGRLIYERGHVRFEPGNGVAATLNGEPITGPVSLALADPKADRPADRLLVGRVTLQLHESGARLGVRLRDPEAPFRRRFSALRWFPVDETWRLKGRLIPYDEPRDVEVQNVLGDIEQMRSPGEVEVAIGGRTLRLVALQASRGRLWLVFSDRTAGGLTYRIRFLYADAPDASGGVVVDFNRAYNPPCAFNPHTTCPLPPRQNRLPVAVEAGEQKYPGPQQPSAND